MMQITTTTTTTTNITHFIKQWTIFVNKLLLTPLLIKIAIINKILNSLLHVSQFH